MRPVPLLAFALLVGPALAGCFEPEAPTVASVAGAVRVLGPDGAVLADAAATLLGPNGVPLALVPVDAGGWLPVANVSLADEVVVSAPGHVAWRGAPAQLPSTLVLEPLATAPAADDAEPVLRFLTPMEMGKAYLADDPATCDVSNCGASEPSVEVAGDGSVYVTGVCCIGKSPPIWASRDGGASFAPLEGDLLREAFGIEGDFAIDDAGNLYFSDISAASAYFASWDKDGQHRWTIPAGAFVPAVDRPWVRADAEDHVVFAYNALTTTNVYTSDDGARTWTLRYRAPGGLGSLGQGPERTTYWLTAGEKLHQSTDAGETWASVADIPRPSETGTSTQAYEVPVVDEAGNVWLVYDWQDRTDVECTGGGPLEARECTPAPFHVYAVRYDPEGEWHGPYRVSPEAGTHVYPWAAAGRDGTLAVAWYAAPDAVNGSVEKDTPWFVTVGVTLDGTAEAPSWQVAHADPEPVLKGAMGRRLLDFLQIDVGPDGALHLAYAKGEEGQPDEATWYVRTTRGLALAPARFPNGPSAEDPETPDAEGAILPDAAVRRALR